jgi:hypothetical protein
MSQHLVDVCPLSSNEPPEYIGHTFIGMSGNLLQESQGYSLNLGGHNLFVHACILTRLTPTIKGRKGQKSVWMSPFIAAIHIPRLAALSYHMPCTPYKLYPSQG